MRAALGIRSLFDLLAAFAVLAPASPIPIPGGPPAAEPAANRVQSTWNLDTPIADSSRTRAYFANAKLEKTFFGTSQADCLR